MPAATRSDEPLRFGRFELDLRRSELRRDGVLVPLPPKPYALLALFASQAGRVLGKEELFARVWPGVVVSDDALTQCVHELRQALGPEGAALIRTVPRRGYRFDAPPPGASQSVASPPAASSTAKPRADRSLRRTPRPVVALGASIAAVLAIALAVAAFMGTPSASSARPPLSIVVLPLTADSADGSNGWFADALGADLTAELGRVAGTFVISRETAATYRGRAVDPRVVARELGVRYVVTGNVGREDERVRLTLVMIDGASGAQHVVEQLDFERGALAASMLEAARRLARSLSVGMHLASGDAAARLSPGQVSADDLAMQGFAIVFRGLTPENHGEATARFEAAVEQDPGSIRGWGGIAAVAGAAGSLLWMPRDAALARLEEVGRRLQVLDQDNYYTYMTRSFRAFLLADWDTKLQTHREMVKRFPSHPYAHMGHALALAALGQFEQCIESAQWATRLGPRDYSAAVYIYIAATCHFMRGDHAQAAQLARTAYGMNPRLPSPPVLLAAALALDGRSDEARAVVAEYLQRNPGYRAEHLGRFLRGRDARYLEGRDRAIAALRTVGMP